MTTVEVSRTLVKSAPELWTELQGDRLSAAVGEVNVWTAEPERELAWEAAGARGTAILEPSGWGTKVTLTAEIEEQVAELGVWARLRGAPMERSRATADMERRLESLLEVLGSAHRQPFMRE